MFPSSTLFHYPILLLLADGKKHSIKECRNFVISHLSITQKQIEEKTPGGKKTKPRSKLHSWTDRAITDLKSALFIKHFSDGYIITSSGKSFIENHNDGFVSSALAEESEAYRKYKKIGEYRRTTTYNKKAIKSSPDNSHKSEGTAHRPNNSDEGFVYILTNEAFKANYIKIGFTTNLEERLKSLYNTSVPKPFTVFALMQTKKYQYAEKLMHNTFKDFRIGDDREFFMLIPDMALEQLKLVAEMVEAKVIVFSNKGKEKKVFNFSKPSNET